MLSQYIAPVIGIVVTTSASIAFDGVAKQLVPSDLKAVPAFAVKIGVAVVGGMLAGKIAQIVVDNVESVIATANKDEESEEVDSIVVEEEN